jgi:hypothetical protein
LKTDSIGYEIRSSYSLLFSRKERSRKKAVKRFSNLGISVQFTDKYEYGPKDASQKKSVRIAKWDRRPFLHRYRSGSPHLEQFQHYRFHLASLQRQMNEWKPQTVRELFIPGYKDRFAWWTTIFAASIGLFGKIGLVASIIQTVVAFQSYNVSVQALNISLEALRLQQESMNSPT